MALPDWLDPLYEAAEMRALDAWAIEERGVPALDLKERAGIGPARVAAEVAGSPRGGASSRGGPLRVVVGKGNNGGDGLVVARRLAALGAHVEVRLSLTHTETTAGAVALAL